MTIFVRRNYSEPVIVLNYITGPNHSGDSTKRTTLINRQWVSNHLRNWIYHVLLTLTHLPRFWPRLSWARPSFPASQLPIPASWLHRLPLLREARPMHRHAHHSSVSWPFLLCHQPITRLCQTRSKRGQYRLANRTQARNQCLLPRVNQCQGTLSAAAALLE
jgi:hypothetical protein